MRTTSILSVVLVCLSPLAALLDISASSRDQFSWFNTKVGGWFTHTFCNQLPNNNRWEPLLQSVSQRSNSFFHDSRQDTLTHAAANDPQIVAHMKQQTDMVPQAFQFNVDPDPYVESKR